MCGCCYFQSFRHLLEGLHSGNETDECTVSSQTIQFSIQPKAGSSTVKMQDITSSKIGKDGEVKTGWVHSSPNTVSVRGQKYLSDNQKIPSPGSLYELIEVDAVHSKEYFTNIGEKVTVPEIESFNDDESHCKFVAPSLLIISFALPTATQLFKKSNERREEGYIVTGYYRMRKETRKILKTISNPQYDPSRHNEELCNEIGMEHFRKLNAVRLWEQWCTEAQTDPEMQKRLKFIPRGDNLKDLGVPEWICKYNGKPMLIKRPGETSFLYRNLGQSMMEIGVSLHPLPYLFKKAMAYLRNTHFPNMLMTFSFLIEGRDEDELPEVLLGDPFILPYVESETVQTADCFFSKPRI